MRGGLSNFVAMEKKFDIIIFGASGFTGEFVVEQLAKNAFEENVRWAVAGRNRQKVQQILMKVQKRLDTDQDLERIQIFEADVDDKASLEFMCQSTKLIINCVGPYGKYGEPVLEACLRCKTHSIDMTVEITYLSEIMVKYYKEAETQETYIISSCGLAYVFFEMGIQLLLQKFEGRIEKIDVFVKPELKARSVHFASWKSVIDMNSSLSNFLVSRQKIYSEIMNKTKSKRSVLGLSLPVKPSRDAKGLGFTVPTVLHPSQVSLDMTEETCEEKSVKCNYYWTIDSVVGLLILFAVGLFFICLFPFSAGRWLMTKYAGFFSCGLVNVSAVTEETKDTSFLNFTAVATGFNRRQRHIVNVVKIPKRTAVLHGYSPPAYKTSAICLVHAALTVLQESDRLPKRGGVYTPLVAFAKTSLPSRLQKNGIMYKGKNGEFFN